MLVLLVLSLLGLVSAQSTTNASTTDIEDVEANFQAAQLVPELLSTFTPEGTLSISFSGSTITPGQNLTESDVSSYPTLSVMPASNATAFDPTSMYTVMMVDANPVGTDESSTEQTRHWLVNGASLGDSAPYAVNYTGSTPVTNYAGPGPASGSGSHRYVILIYSQPSTFTAPANLSTAGTPLGTFSFSDYVSSSGLGPLIAANYFQVEVGVATATVAATTSVNSATLAGAASTSSASASGASGASGSAASGSTSTSTSKSGSSTGTTSNAAATSSKGAAGRKEVLGWGVVIGGLGVVGTVLGAGIGFLG
ncbi:MAG: hypothetical protein TREMPRED_001670 [Tremellales sp. Tagirdzhanova-0007]|nr:MAG: hypothetical protein TREMPRED_001670 [Tremellales sp. Tagirdzhanova-0007]